MKKCIVLIFSVLLMCSCTKEGSPVSVAEQKEDFNVQFLFEVDGISVYRFFDGGTHVYFTSASGKAGYKKTHSNGKTSYTETVETLCNKDG